MLLFTACGYAHVARRRLYLPQFCDLTLLAALFSLFRHAQCGPYQASEKNVAACCYFFGHTHFARRRFRLVIEVKTLRRYVTLTEVCNSFSDAPQSIPDVCTQCLRRSRFPREAGEALGRALLVCRRVVPVRRGVGSHRTWRGGLEPSQISRETLQNHENP